MIPNYLEVISEHYPTSNCHTTGNPTDYNSIVWDTAIISQSDLNGKALISYMTHKIIEFSENAKAEITNGFN